jgi:threonine dehydrogenase-like Zn-dependent dehydrogenase
MSDESAVMVEPFACIRHALSRLDLEGIERILISGGGPMGATTALQVRNRCVETVVIEPDPWRRAFLKDLGLPVRANPRRGEPFAAVIDCVGIGVPGLLEYLAPGGQLLLIGCRPEYEAHFRPFNLIQKQANIIGSCDYDDSDFTDALQDVSQRPLGHLITHNVALTSFGRAFDLLGMTSSPLYSAMKVAITAQN